MTKAMVSQSPKVRSSTLAACDVAEARMAIRVIRDGENIFISNEKV